MGDEAAPLPLVALEVDPGDPKRWIGPERGIFVLADDGGRRGASATRRRTCASRGPTTATLYRIDPGGPVKVSTDGGERWEDRGSTGGEPQAMTVDDAGKIYVALIDGTLKVSEDGGETFTDQVRRRLDPARLARGGLGRVELALDEVEPAVPEARVGEVDADDRPSSSGLREPPAASSSR